MSDKDNEMEALYAERARLSMAALKARIEAENAARMLRSVNARIKQATRAAAKVVTAVKATAKGVTP